MNLKKIELYILLLCVALISGCCCIRCNSSEITTYESVNIIETTQSNQTDFESVMNAKELPSIDFTDKDNTQDSFYQDSNSHSEHLISTNVYGEIESMANKTNSTILEYIVSNERFALAALLNEEKNIEFWFFDCCENDKLLTVTTDLEPHCIKYTDYGKEFLIVCDFAPGEAMPASIVTITNNEPIILSEYNTVDSNDFSSELYYSQSGNIVCMRGNGISAGSVNIIPYHWCDEMNNFCPYDFYEISKEQAKKYDNNDIICNLNDAISIYQRGNGLIHVNYLRTNEFSMDLYDSTQLASATYVITQMGLKEYDFIEDASYGFFLQQLPVLE